ncbi:hypothetical protein [Desulfitobacterium chlororespirans]|nr:hypothetical protein [Desulfitobacterium chlororespirans]
MDQNDCSQIVLSYVSGKFGMDEKTARKVWAAFGLGMWGGSA